jgi:hypothetical protein
LTWNLPTASARRAVVDLSLHHRQAGRGAHHPPRLTLTLVTSPSRGGTQPSPEGDSTLRGFVDHEPMTIGIAEVLPFAIGVAISPVPIIAGS